MRADLSPGSKHAANTDEDLVTAFHEAGHAWAYHRSSMPLRYITIRPRTPGVVGLTKPWKPRRGHDQERIAAAGPLAQAIHAQSIDDCAYPIDWEDQLFGAILFGGESVALVAGLYLEAPVLVNLERANLLADWDRIAALAHALVERRTVSGLEAFRLLSCDRRKRHVAEPGLWWPSSGRPRAD